jgi:hypothetical protein
MHVSAVAVTGGGKSFLVRYGLVPLWSDYRVLVLDVKGDDPTYAGFGQVVGAFPQEELQPQQPNSERQRIYRLVVPEWEFTTGRRETEGLRRARQVAGEAMDIAYKQGKWVIVLDETRAITDATSNFGLGLRGVVENIWQRGRSREVTMVACTQQPIWMPSSFYSQPSILYIGRMLEPPTDHLREIGGDTRLMRQVLPQLRGRRNGGPDFLVVERDSGEMRITKVAAAQTAAKRSTAVTIAST